MAQGFQYAGLFYISPTQTSMMLSIREIKNRGIFVGILGVMVGTFLYYYPWSFESGSLIGIGLVVLSSVGYTINLSATRYFVSNELAQVKDLVLRPMLIGAIFMVGVGLINEGLPLNEASFNPIVAWISQWGIGFLPLDLDAKKITSLRKQCA